MAIELEQSTCLSRMVLYMLMFITLGWRIQEQTSSIHPYLMKPM